MGCQSTRAACLTMCNQWWGSGGLLEKYRPGERWAGGCKETHQTRSRQASWMMGGGSWLCGFAASAGYSFLGARGQDWLVLGEQSSETAVQPGKPSVASK